MPRSILLALLAPLLTVLACSHHSEPIDRSIDRAGPVARSAPASSVVRAAPDRAAAAGSARIEVTVTIDGPHGPWHLRSSGAFAGDRTTLSTDLGSMLASLPEADVGPLPEGIEEPARTIHDGDTVYVRLPLLDPLTGTSGWLSTTPDSAALTKVGAVDPLRALMILRDATDEVDEVGREQVRGADTTRYRATIGDQHVDVWLDADGRPRRLRIPLPDTARDVGVAAPATMVVEVFDYGDPIEIAVPAPGEVTPLAEVVPG
jgi:hypothetical protein